MKHLKSFNENITQSDNIMIVHNAGYEYTVAVGEIPKPGEFGYLPPTNNDGITGLIVKVLNERMYPTAKKEGDMDSYRNVWKIDVINKEDLGTYKGPDKNYKGKIHTMESIHLSHFKKGGKIISSTDPRV